MTLYHWASEGGWRAVLCQPWAPGDAEK